MKTLFPFKWIALVALALGLTSCAHTSTVSYQQLRLASLAHHGDSFPDTTYYCGTEDGFDCFYIEYGAPNYELGRKYRVLSSKSPIKKPFDLTTKDGWVKVTLYDDRVVR